MKDYMKHIKNVNKEFKYTLTLNDIESYVKVEANYVEIVSYSANFEDVYNIVKYYTDEKYEITHLEFDFCRGKKQGLLKYDYTYLYEIKKYLKANKQSPIFDIIYDSFCTANYDDFISMIECLKWYRSLIDESDLTPVEKLTYAYDICKTIKYNQSGYSSYDITNDNLLHMFVKTGNIVCLGYNRLLKELISNIPGLTFSEFTVRCYEVENHENECHSRGIVKIDDENYDIHGIYMLDPTWDSVVEDNKEVYGDKYDSLSGYRYFLVPIYKYGKFFKGDTYPRIFRGKHNFAKEQFLTRKKLDRITYGYKQNENLVDRKLISEEIRPLISKKMTMSELYSYLNCDRPDTETFVFMIARTRLAEGYRLEDIDGSLVYGIDTNNKYDGIIISIDCEKEKKLVL